MASPIVESVQLRACLNADELLINQLDPAFAVAKFVVEPRKLIAGGSGVLRALAGYEIGYAMFLRRLRPDPLEDPKCAKLSFRIGVDSCTGCHGGGILSVASRNQLFRPKAVAPPVFRSGTLSDSLNMAFRKKTKHASWILLEELFPLTIALDCHLLSRLLLWLRVKLGSVSLVFWPRQFAVPVRVGFGMLRKVLVFPCIRVGFGIVSVFRFPDRLRRNGARLGQSDRQATSENSQPFGVARITSQVVPLVRILRDLIKLFLTVFVSDVSPIERAQSIAFMRRVVFHPPLVKCGQRLLRPRPLSRLRVL